MSVPTYAVIPSRSRPVELKTLLGRLGVDGVQPVVVDNGYEEGTWDHSAWVVRDVEQPPNLYRLWNLGLNAVDELRGAESEWNVIVLNDDADLPPGWILAVSAAVRDHDVIAACTDTYGAFRVPTVSRDRDRNLWKRMCPWAFVIRGEVGLRADESFRWWWGDTDLDWRIRDGGGLVTLPGMRVTNTHANSTTVGELAIQAGRDRETFARKWGTVPW